MSGIRKYTKDVLEPLVRDSLSYAEVIRKLGRTPGGSTQSLVVRRIREHGIDVSHFMGQGRNRGMSHKGGSDKKHWSEILVLRDKDFREKSYRLRRALIESGRKYECECPECDGVGWVLADSYGFIEDQEIE